MEIFGSAAWGGALAGWGSCVYKLAADGTNTESFELTAIDAIDFNATGIVSNVNLVGNTLAGGTVQSTNANLGDGSGGAQNTYNTAAFGLGNFAGIQLTSFEIQFTTPNVGQPCNLIDFNSFTITGATAPSPNSAPTATNRTQTVNYVEDTTKAIANMVIVDGDTDTWTASVSMTANNSTIGSLTAASGNGETYTAGTGVWTVSSATLATVNSALAAMSYVPVANDFTNTTAAVSISDGVAAAITGTISFNGSAEGDTPSVTAASTNEDTQTTSGLVVTKNAADGAEVTHYKVTTINNGTLYKSNGTTQISNNNFITLAEGTAGLKFTPTANSSANGTITVAAATSNAGAGLGGGAIATITVSAVGDLPTVTNAATNEDTQTTSGLVLTKNAADGAEVTHYKITSITGGTLYKNNGTTVISNNAFITIAEGTAGLKFTPTANSNTNGSFTAAAATSNAGAGLGAGATATITVTAIADTPTITNAATNEDTQSASGLVIGRNGNDGTEVSHFKITSIAGGTLYKTNGTTAIANNAYITFAEASAGLKFTPTANSVSNGSFNVQGATSAAGAGLSAASATATITLTAVNDVPSFSKGANEVVNENAGAQTVIGWATALSKGPADESAQTLTFSVTNNTNAGLFSAGPAIAANGTLTYTPTANSSGVATITVSVTDSGGTANSGVNTSATQTFTITVNGVAPTISSISIPDTAKKVGSVVPVTITVTSDTGDYTTGSGGIAGTIGGFALGSLSKTNNTTYAASFTVTEAGVDVAAGANIPVNFTLTDSAGNTSAAFTTAIAQAADAIDANSPTVTSVTVPANGTYGLNQTLDFTVNLSDAVTITNTPRLTLTIGGVTKYATYVIGSGTTALGFRYTVEAGLTDADGIVVAGTIDPNTTGTLTEASGNNLNTTLNSVAALSAVLVNSVAPTANFTAATDDVGTVTGALTSGDTTDDTALVLSGTNASGSTVAVYNGVNMLSAATVVGTGWTYSATIANGVTYQFNVKETDGASNVSAATANFTVIGDTAAPTANFTAATDNVGTVTGALTTGDTTDDTALLLSGSNAAGSTVDVYNGAAFLGAATVIGTNWTYSATVANGVTYQFNVKESDAAGNSSAATTNFTVTGDTAAPGVTITSTHTALAVGDVATLTFTLNEAATDFVSDDITVTGGTLSAFATTSATVYTASFTPTVNSTTQATIDVAGTTFTDAAGLANTAAQQKTMTVNTIQPIATITSSLASLKAGDVATLTFTLNTASVNFAIGDITVVGGVLSNFAAQSSSVYTANFTPTANSVALATVDVAGTTFTDVSGNNNGASVQKTMAVDTMAPTVTISSSATALKAGQTATLTFTLSETATDFAVGDITVAGGTLSAFAATSGTVYSATFTPTPNSTVQATVDVAGTTFTDPATNANSAATQFTMAVDTIVPTVTITSSLAALAVGDVATLTFTLSEAATDFVVGDITVAGGTLSNFVAQSGTVYTASFTPTGNSTTLATVDVAGTTFTDAATNANTVAQQFTITVDTIAPTVTITSSATALKAGQTATLTFTLSEASTNFAVGDISVTGGALSAFATTSSTVYTATFTPTSNSTTGATVDVAGAKFTNAATNANTVAQQFTITVDTIAPTVTITSSATALKAGQTATLTFTLSEASTNFAVGDISVTGGALSSFVGSGTVYTASFTPGNAIAATVDVAGATFTDTATNPNSAATQLGMTINVAPTFNAAPSITQTAPVGATLTLSNTATTDLNNQAVILSYQWKAGGANITGASAATYTLTAAQAHQDITCVVTASDGAGGSTSATTAAVTVANSSPVLNKQGINGGILQNATTGTYTFTATDLDSNDVHTYSLTTPTLGTATFNQNVLTYNATVVGTEALTLTINDANGGVVNYNFQLTVNDPAATGTNAPSPSGSGLTIGQTTALGLDPATGDTDGDGILDATEVGDPANPTDTDGDGVPDVFEPTVGANDKANDRSVAAGLPMSSGSVTITSTAEIITGVTHTATGAGAPADMAFPYGELSYNTTVPVGGSKVVRLSFTTALPTGLVLYKVSAAGVYSALPTNVWTEVDANTVDITLTDGDGITDLGSLTPDGIIIDPVAIGAPTAAQATAVSSGGGCSLQQGSKGGIDPMLPLLMLLSAFWMLKRHGKALLRGGAAALLLVGVLGATPATSEAAEKDDAKWRIGAYWMSAKYPADTTKYKKVLPGYVGNLGYMLMPWMEAGILVSGAKNGTDTRDGNSVVLKMPVLPQAYVRFRQQLGGDWGIYEMLTVGAMRSEAVNRVGTVILSDRRVVALGLGAGVSYDINQAWSVDVGAFAPGIAISKRNTGLRTQHLGAILALNYAFGGSEKSAPIVRETIAEPVAETIEPVADPVVVAVVEPEPVVVAEAAPLPENIQLESIIFEPYSVVLSAEAKVVLDRAIEQLKPFPDMHLEVAAHTDTSGNAAENVELSHRRAISVRYYLMTHGLNAEHIQAKGYGSSKPRFDNATTEGRAKIAALNCFASVGIGQMPCLNKRHSNAGA